MWYVVFNLEIKLECSIGFILKLNIFLGDENVRGGKKFCCEVKCRLFWGGVIERGYWFWLSELWYL